MHHAFENGMAWVFRTCRTLSPRTAVLVLVGAVLWLPISFGVATLMHAVLIAKALSLPAWMQLLHPVATVIAKSKLLVLPVYPAAWPQAKQHPADAGVDPVLELSCGALLCPQDWPPLPADRDRRCTRQRPLAPHGGGHGADAARQCRARWSQWQPRLDPQGDLDRDGAPRRVLSRFPVFGGIVQRYTEHYDQANREPALKFSEHARGFFERWSVKFTVEYYDAQGAARRREGRGQRVGRLRDATSSRGPSGSRSRRSSGSGSRHCGRSTSPCGSA